MRRISRKNRAFTLVEILIVVVILGILAAIVVPQFARAADDARGGNIQTQLNTLQNSIELFRAREGEYPDFTNLGWQQLLGDTTGDNLPDPGEIQYIKALPVNPAIPSTSAIVDTSVAVGPGTTGSAAAAWVWDSDPQVLRLFASHYDEVNNEIDPADPLQ